MIILQGKSNWIEKEIENERKANDISIIELNSNIYGERRIEIKVNDIIPLTNEEIKSLILEIEK
jgi:hypothetical protein